MTDEITDPPAVGCSTQGHHEIPAIPRTVGVHGESARIMSQIDSAVYVRLRSSVRLTGPVNGPRDVSGPLAHGWAALIRDGDGPLVEPVGYAGLAHEDSLRQERACLTHPRMNTANPRRLV